METYWNKRRQERKGCPNCGSYRFKISHTHGKKSRGKKICKGCRRIF